MAERAPIPAAASVAVLPVLAGSKRAARLVGVYPRALYLDDGQNTIGVVTRDALRLPNTLVLSALQAELPFAGIRDDTPALFGGGTVSVGHLTIAPRRTWDPRPALRVPAPSLLTRQVRELARLLAGRRCGIPVHPRFGTAAARGDLTTAALAAGRLVGLGPGSTPSGDDVLAGALATLRLLGGDGGFIDALADAILADARGRTTSLSAALLACAARGEVSPQVADVLRGLTGEQPLAPAVARLLRVGHTSGADLAHGVLIGARAASHHDEMRRAS